nr:hypothetical protein [uncultured Kingella sp.]
MTNLHEIYSNLDKNAVLKFQNIADPKNESEKAAINVLLEGSLKNGITRFQAA